MQDNLTAPTPEAQPVAPIPSDLREWLVTIGRKGGASKSPRKLGAIAANLAKAQAARWAGRGKVTAG